MTKPSVMASVQEGESQCVAVKEGDDALYQRVLEALRLGDDDHAEKLAGDETIEEMVRRINRELDEEFEDFDWKEAVIGKMIAMAEDPTMAAMAENATTTTAVTTAASATATTGAGRTSTEATVNAKRLSIAEPPPLEPAPTVATPPSPSSGTSGGSKHQSTGVLIRNGIKNSTIGIYVP